MCLKARMVGVWNFLIIPKAGVAMVDVAVELTIQSAMSVGNLVTLLGSVVCELVPVD